LDLKNVPDEIFDWIKQNQKSILSEYSKIEKECKDSFNKIYTKERKKFAENAIKNQYSSILFKMYDKKPYDELIWKIIKPESKTYNLQNGNN
jgi:hypothetical protein